MHDHPVTTVADITLVPVTTDRKDEYLEFSHRMAEVYYEHGATRVVEYWQVHESTRQQDFHADGVQYEEGELPDFAVAAGASESESIVVTVTEWPSLSARDRGIAAATKDPRVLATLDEEPVFDGGRLLAGSFQITMAPPGGSRAGERVAVTTGRVSRWNAWSHRLMGDVTAIDSQVTYLLALADARTVQAVERLFVTYARVSLAERADLLQGLPDPPHYPGAFQRVADWVRRLSVLRNQLAHATIVEATDEFARLDSFYRGRRKQTLLWRPEMSYAHRMARMTTSALSEMTPASADLEVWAQVMGFDEGYPQDQEVSQ